ncbi:unnamed protein product [Polarella glacialis]|uniref:AAA+ ATPase domain-containing protein n=2 Tax=Polarella glacialis TaxID=89957 RepID=A0A813IR68_POLGL|nr:unnamed protein product [Polarella glacialis]
MDFPSLVDDELQLVVLQIQKRIGGEIKEKEGWHGGVWPRPSEAGGAKDPPADAGQIPQLQAASSGADRSFNNNTNSNNNLLCQQLQEPSFSLCVSVLGSCTPALDLQVADWHDFTEQLEECGIPAAEQHPQNFQPGVNNIEKLVGQALEMVDHQLWLLLDMLPREIQPTKQLSEFMEVKLRVGQVAQMRTRCRGVSPVLSEINDVLVTEAMLDAIVSHARLAPAPRVFHQGRAGVLDRAGGEARSILHRITAVWGHKGYGRDSCGSAGDLLLAAAVEMGRSCEQVRPYIQKLKDRWYDTAKPLRSISHESWRQMEIPENLYHAVQRKLGASCLTGLTLRVGRPFLGVCDRIQDSVSRCLSTLLIGQAGVGKSTVLREMARLLSDKFHKCFVVVDTTSELGGFGSVAHEALGTRDMTRLTVSARSDLFQVMLDAVQNHSARIIIVDELRDAKEVEAARTIANQGVVLFASVHACNLSQLAHNPTLSPLIGNVKSALIGDQRMQETHSQSKYQEFLEYEPAFSTVIEISETGQWRVIDDVSKAVTELLNGRDDGGREVNADDADELPPNWSADTGSTSSGSSLVDVQRPGVGKVPAQLMAKLCSGSTIMCCFDGGVSWGMNGGPHRGGSGSCLFQIRSDGRKGQHLPHFDQTAFLPDATVDQAEFAGLLAGVESLARCWDQFFPEPGLLLIEGDRKVIIDDVQAGLHRSSANIAFPLDPTLQPVFDHIVSALRKLEERGVKICLRHRPRRFNKVADQLTRKARDEQAGNFQHELLDKMVNQQLHLSKARSR